MTNSVVQNKTVVVPRIVEGEINLGDWLACVSIKPSGIGIEMRVLSQSMSPDDLGELILELIEVARVLKLEGVTL
jgi:hypothetical protein